MASHQESNERDYVRIAIDYAKRAANKKNHKTYCKWIRLAAKRFLDDLKHAETKKPRFVFDEWHANDVCDFIEKLPHVEGTWDSVSIVLHESDVFFLVNLFGFRKYQDGPRRFTSALKAIGRKNAKALALDTPIPTPDGWRVMADIHPGDLVYGSHGRAVKVLAESEVFYDKRCYRMIFSDGSEIISSADHLWTTRHAYRPWAKPRINGSGNGGRQRIDTLTTEQIAVSVMRTRADGGTEYNHKIDNAPALKSVDIDLPISPYTLGAWLGDGHTAGARFTCSREDTEILDGIRSDGWPVIEQNKSNSKASTYALTNGDRSQKARDRSLAAHLRSLNVIGRKHIPDSYLNAGLSQRWALLQGLMDTDGTVNRCGGQTTARCSFTGTNDELTYGVWRLARSLGLKATRHKGIAKLNGRIIGPKWRVDFPADQTSKIFRLARKQSLLPPSLGKRSKTLTITSCEEVKSVATKCIAVDSEDHLFLAGHGCIATHNSTIAAAIGLYCENCEGENGPQIVSAAKTGKQARIIFDIAKRMVELTSALREAFSLQPMANSIVNYNNGGTFKPINSKASTQDGLNPSTALIDEIHAHKDSDLLNVLRSAAGARSNPLFLFTTTEGYESLGPWSELRNFSQQVLEGVIEADHFLVLFYTLDDDDDEFDESKWIKANPLIEVNPILLDEIRKEAIEAKAMPGKAAEFRIKRCNRRSATSKGWIDFQKWKSCAGSFDLDMLRTVPCWGGMDLSSTRDITSFRLVWHLDDIWYTHGWKWVPSEQVEFRTTQGTVPYQGWVESGHLIQIDGATIDYRVVTNSILDIASKFNLQMIGYDPWNAATVVKELEDDGLTMEAFIQGPKSYHPAMSGFEVVYSNGNLRHNADPVLTWNASNLVVRYDENNNMAPSKKRSADKIDDMVALLMAFGVANREPENKPNPYAERGIRTLEMRT